MKCYICDKEGKESETIAICIVCGIAVCRDHQIREQIPVTETYKWGLGEEKVTLPLPLPRILCTWCYQALVAQKNK
ncbi:MAG: hypothetical protein A2106_05145 [Planctomycetes bacterium GWF2_40_8]|nr:MAG: hypothetical protein A2106_05145 [Planctomycetes bacterium GWF2_40_8]OHB86756.1 MAG: hypothetical protein A3D13_10675 [Planctomycetes bacterium RIFCSPHIGHO2_02_FULL_40_12]OHC04243.1 MAG: hypothetical protein A3H23_08780 [Planctomycetes bacterium RIFCSPLOWO2_12_FULL_40_19]